MKTASAAPYLAMTLLLSSSPASAVQSRPHFSGEWTRLISTPTGTVAATILPYAPVGVPPAGMLSTISIDLRDDVLSITSEYMRQMRTFSHPLDGSEQQWRLTREGGPAAPDEPAQEGITSTAAWEGDRIVLRMAEIARRLSIEQVLSLDEAGRLIVTTSGSAYDMASDSETACFVRSDTIDPSSWGSSFREAAAAACR